MAKLSSINKNERRKKLVKKYANKIAKLKADYQGEKASAARQAAMDRVTSARATLAENLDALGEASAATWDSAKAEVIAATKKLEAAYDDAVADTANN